MNKIFFPIPLLLIATVLSTQSFAQKAFPYIAFVKGMDKQKGFFNIYYDASSDDIFLEVSNLDTEFLYVNSLATGVGSNDIGLDKGQLGAKRVVKFIKARPKLLLVQPNLNYRADSKNAYKKESMEQAFAQSVLWRFKILKEEKVSPSAHFQTLMETSLQSFFNNPSDWKTSEALPLPDGSPIGTNF